MNRITVGQYYPVESTIHHLDARVKLMGTFVFIASLFMIQNPIGYAVAAVLIASLVFLSGVPALLLFKGLRSVMFILLFAFTLNLFLTPGENVLVSFYFLRITAEGAVLAGRMTVRLVLLIVGSSVLTLTTSPVRLTNAIESLLNPLRVLKVPAHEIAMMMTIALGSIPMLMEETDKIIKAQSARGADFQSGGLIKKAKSLIPVMVPLFVSALRRAEEMAVAMDARCYRNGIGRTRMNGLKITGGDYAAMSFFALYLLALVFVQVAFG